MYEFEFIINYLSFYMWANSNGLINIIYDESDKTSGYLVWCCYLIIYTYELC